MKRLLLIGFAACAFVAAPILSASAMPVAAPDNLVSSERPVIQAGWHHGHGHHGGWGHHYGWSRHHHRHW